MIKKFNNLKITRKLFLTLAIVVILYIGTVVTAVYGVHNVTESFNIFYTDSYEAVKQSMTIRVNVNILDRNLLSVMSEQILEDNDMVIRNIDQCDSNIRDAIEQLGNIYADRTEQMQQLKDRYEALNSGKEHVIQLILEDKSEEAAQYYNQECSKGIGNVREFMTNLEAQAQSEALQYHREANDAAKEMNVVIIVQSGLVLIFVMITWFFITRSITRPVTKLKNVAKEISQGNLNPVIDIESKNELGELAESMQNTVSTLRLYVKEIQSCMEYIGHGKLNYKSRVPFKGDFVAINIAMEEISSLLGNAMQQINDSAQQVASGAQQVSGGAQLLSQGASEQAGSIEELAANINEISDSVKLNADDAVLASEKASRVMEKIIESKKQMSHMTVAISQIKENSIAITGIIKEIEDIAFQTNLLALNAAVEAARAGDAGKGFSVVAGEIRKLASKTTDASKMTAELIQKSSHSVEEGTTIANTAAESMVEVVRGADNVVKKIENISHTSMKQANFIIQIRQSIEQISDVIQGNSATSEQSAAASEELAAQAEVLENLVSEFEY